MIDARTLWTLENRFLHARFARDTGGLVHLSAPGRKRSLVARGGVRYQTPEGGVGEGLFADDAGKMQVVRIDARPDEGVIETELRSPVLTVVRRFKLALGSPLLRITCTVRGRADLAAPAAIWPAFPQIDFAPDFVDSFEDEQDLYFPGLEMHGGTQVPAWHVFFRKDHREGLIVVARSKRRMAQVGVLPRGLRGTPHAFNNYSSNPVGPMTVEAATVMDTEIEIGPWDKQKHAALLRAAKLNQPAPVSDPIPAKGRRPGRPPGVVIPATKLAPARAVTTQFSTRKWQLVSVPWTLNRKALYAGAGVSAPALKFTPTQRGLYRIHAGIGNGIGLTLRAAGQPYPALRWRWGINPEDGAAPWPLDLYLSGKRKAHELDMGVYELKGKPLTFAQLNSKLLPCMLDYIRLEKLTPAAAARWRKEELAEPSIPLSGMSDTPDIAFADDAVNPDPDLYRANIWEHARCKVRRIYWRIDGQCSDFPSRHNTMRYVSAKVHGVFYPGAKAYGKALRKVDMLALAVEEAHQHGLELYGWMRFNNYSGNVQSDFFKQNPQWHEVRENGRRMAKLCLAFPEVREHKLSILLEAAEYGVDGVNLGFLRHPPVFMYNPLMVEGYQARYGELPPILANRPDERFINSLPPEDEAHQRWYQYRAEFLTQFGRDLRQRLRAAGRGDVKVAIWVRPNHCLFDGIDLPAWLDEGLCDEVVINGMIGPERVYSMGNGVKYDPVVCGVRPQWKAMIQEKNVELIRCLPYLPVKWWQPHLREVLAEGYDGLCTYESDWSVINQDFIDLYRGLRAKS